MYVCINIFLFNMIWLLLIGLRMCTNSVYMIAHSYTQMYVLVYVRSIQIISLSYSNRTSTLLKRSVYLSLCAGNLSTSNCGWCDWCALQSFDKFHNKCKLRIRRICCTCNLFAMLISCMCCIRVHHFVCLFCMFEGAMYVHTYT